MARTRRESRFFPINVRRLEVVRVVDLGPGMRRVTLGGPQLGAFATADGIEVPPLRNEGFDDHVKVIVPGAGERTTTPPRQVEGHLDWEGASPAKDYTPRRWDPVAGELDLDFVRHGTGFASTWAERVRVGDAAHVAGPKTSALVPHDVDWLLVAGDETALPAIGRLVDDLPVDARAQVFVEVEDERFEIPVPGLDARPGVRFSWVHRGTGVEPGTSDVLEHALRTAPWWQGEVYAWVAGETLTVKPIRAWLKNERQVPRDCCEVTGYWRRTATVATPEGLPATTVDDEAEAYARLDRLLDLATPVALRAAVTTGVLAALEAAPGRPADLAAALRLDEGALRSVLRLLVSHDMVAADPADPAVVGDGRVRLGRLGELLLEDEEHATDLALDGPGDRLVPSHGRLVATLRDGRAAAYPDGRVLADVLGSDPQGAAAHRELRGEGAVWAAPSVVQHHDWGGYERVLVTGVGAVGVADTLRQERPGLDVAVRTGSPRAVLAGVGARDAVLAVHLVDQLPDADAVAALAALAAHGGDVVLAELVLEPDEAPHDHDAVRDVQLRVAFGGGVRTAAETARLVAAAGLVAEDPTGTELGWDMRLWVTRAG